jgi:hypothetical protein
VDRPLVAQADGLLPCVEINPTHVTSKAEIGPRPSGTTGRKEVQQ